MKVLAILEAGDRWPSGVVRGLVYRELFARDGFEVEFVSRLVLAAIDRLQWLPNRAQMLVLEAATRANEVRVLRKARSADVIYLSKVLSPRFLRMLRRVSRARVVLDFGDSVWLDAKGQRNDEAFAQTLSLVNAVTTDNEWTARYVRKFGKQCTVIPDSPQLEAFDRRRGKAVLRAPGKVVVGWIGTSGTLYNLELIAEALREVARRHPEMELRLVGVGSDANALQMLDGLRYSIRASYNQVEMIDEVFGMDVGLFPLKDIEQSHVRGVLKATIYMAGEAAVIASPIGQVGEVIQDGINGLLATTSAEWVEKLSKLVEDEALRRTLAASGLETVRRGFRTDQSWALLRAVLRDEELRA